jgi:short-subunit dehydrogenase
LARKAISTHGRIDVLVNNAGSGWSGPVTGMTAGDVQRIVEVDLVAAIDLTRLLLPGMVERGSGAVCFVTSVAGRTGVAGEAVYSAAKAGLDAFAESLRAEAVGSGVQVSVVVPGAVDTPFFTTRGAPYGRRLPRPVPPQSVAAAVVRAVVDGRAETWVPRWLRLAPAVRALAPAPYRRLTAAFGGTQRLSARGTSRHTKPDRPARSWP